MITAIKQFGLMEEGTTIYVARTPKSTIYETMFINQTQGKYSVVNPVFEFKLIEGELATRVDSNIDFGIEEVYQDLDDYASYHTHDFYVTVSYDEILHLIEKGLKNVIDTHQRSLETFKRMQVEFSETEYVQKSMNDNPELWI